MHITRENCDSRVGSGIEKKGGIKYYGIVTAHITALRGGQLGQNTSGSWGSRYRLSPAFANIQRANLVGILCETGVTTFCIFTSNKEL